MNSKKINIVDFAGLAGVSTATVSRAFSGNGRISSKTRQTILALADKVGYAANIHARNLISKRSNTIGFLYPAISHEEPDFFITEIMQGISETLFHTGHILQIHPFSGDDSISLSVFRESFCNNSYEGVIIVAGDKNSKELVNIAKIRGLPYMVIGHMPGVSVNAVTFDNEQGAMLAGKYFRNTGRKNPAYIAGHLDKRKKTGFVKGLEELAEKLIVVEGGPGFRYGSQAIRNILAANSAVDCVLCANDVMAIGFIKAALTAGIRIPEDIAVIGFDDICMARYVTPSVSSISLHLFDIGATAVRQLGKIMQGEPLSHSENIECDLILRESS